MRIRKILPLVLKKQFFLFFYINLLIVEVKYILSTVEIYLFLLVSICSNIFWYSLSYVPGSFIYYNKGIFISSY